MVPNQATGEQNPVGPQRWPWGALQLPGHPSINSWPDRPFHPQVLLTTRAERCSATPSYSTLCRWAAVLSTSAMLPTSTATCWPTPLSASWVSCHEIVPWQGFTVVWPWVYGVRSFIWMAGGVWLDLILVRWRCVPLFADMAPRMLGPKNQLIKVIENNHTFLDCPFFGSPLPDLRWWAFNSHLLTRNQLTVGDSIMTLL